VKPQDIPDALEAKAIPVLVDPDADILLSSLRQAQDFAFHFPILIDARLLKSPPSPLPRIVPLHVGLGPGFHAGINCHAAIETRRSHSLGRVYWNGSTQPDSGQPEGDPRRVLRAPSDGVLATRAQIGEHVEQGQLVAVVGEQHPVVSPLAGVLRGLLREGLYVREGLKIGDVDPRDDPAACFLVSDKALAVGGGVLEAILGKDEIRKQLWE
jgi:xanthine dehydrogenase accessory factor